MKRAWLPFAGALVWITMISCGRVSPTASPVTPPAASIAPAQARPVLGLATPTGAAPADAAAPASTGVTFHDSPTQTPAAESWSELEIPGHEPAIVSMPRSTSHRHPVLVAAHGLGEDPKQWCEWCRELAGSRPVILCLRGSATGRTSSQTMSYSHTSPRAMRREATRALKALQARHPDQIDAREALFVGFSLGANTGAQVVLDEPATFPRALLIEGGNEIWDRKSAPRFGAAGGRKILFACGTEGCRRWAEFSRRRLERAGIAVKIALGDGGGHNYRTGPVGEAVRGSFSWVIEDDPRWSSSGGRP